MRTKLIALAGALLLVAACESTPEDTGGTTGTGGSTGPTTTTPQATTPSPGVDVREPGMIDNRTMTEVLIEDVGDRVFFDFDRATIRPDGEATLRRQAQFLRDNANLRITVAGHCDERGTREYNLALGERRATAAKNFLVSLGVDASRVITTSFGKERPIVLGHNEAAWAQNRVSITSIN
jgi:peptidoglycan-associated lipoprotein